MRRSLTRVTTLIALLGAAPAAWGASLVVGGAWSTTIDAADLVAGAGSPLQDAHESLADQVLVDITDTSGPSAPWTLEVRRADAVWSPDLKVFVRRSSGGSGLGTITGGLAWIEVGDADRLFFEGEGDRQSIGLQVRITGVSLHLDTDTHFTSLVYTVVTP